MRNKTWLVLISAFAALMLATIACNGGRPPAQSPTGIVSAPTQPDAVPVQNGLDGDWQGKTSENTDISINVTNNQVTYFNFSYVLQDSSCTGSGGFGDMVSFPIVDGKFVVEWSDAANQKVIITGTFTPNGQVNGTIDYTAQNEVCGEIHKQMTWNALNAPAIAAGTVIAPAQDQPSGQAGFDGNWDGTNSEGNQVSFKVENNQITYVFFNYSVSTNGCSLGGAMGNSPENNPINGDNFSVEFKDDEGKVFTFVGKFSSGAEANGTIHVKGVPSGFCGAFDTELTWSASRGGSAAGNVDTAPATEAPTASAATEMPAATTDNVTVVTQFFNAINMGDINGALALADEHIIYNFGGSTNSLGSDKLQAYLNSSVAQGLTYEISNITTFGDVMVNFSAKASDGTVYAKSQAFVENGKISMFSLKK